MHKKFCQAHLQGKVASVGATVFAQSGYETNPPFTGRFIGEQGLEVWETHDWPGVLELMSRHVDPVPKKAEGLSRSSKDAGSHHKEVLSPYEGICPNVRPSDSVAIDMDCLESAGESQPNGINAGKGLVLHFFPEGLSTLRPVSWSPRTASRCVFIRVAIHRDLLHFCVFDGEIVAPT